MSIPIPRPTDADLAEINALLDWHAGAPLPDGRLLGRLGRSPGKRAAPAAIPDKRIRRLHKMLNLKNKRVLEIGCFEGIHTVGLRQFCEDVTAIDVRPQNVLKTMTRLSWHGVSAHVHQFDAELITPDFPSFDVIYHIGVLYHLTNPIEHLLNLSKICQHLYLDTHVAAPEKANVTLEVAGHTYRAAKHREGGWADPFSGKDSYAVWLTCESLLDALSQAGFAEVQVLEKRAERNGPRVLILATTQSEAREEVRATRREKKAVL